MTEDIIGLAELFRDMVKSPTVTDCHTFMASIFKVPGSLKRTDIERIRMSVSQEITNR